MEPHHTNNSMILKAALHRCKLIGLSIKNIDTYGVIEDVVPKKMRIAEHRYGFCTDLPMILELSDGRFISINASSFKDVYEGFGIVINPDLSKYNDYRDNNLNVAGYCKECLGKKITGYEVTEYGKDVPNDVQNISTKSPKELILILEDGTRMIFSHWLMAEYMDFDVELPRNDKEKETTDDFDTYSPTELGEYLSKLNLKGRTITKIESPSRITSSNKKERLKVESSGEYILTYKDAEIDRPIYLTFDDGRRIGFCFCSVSHVFVDPNPDINIEKERDYEKDEINVSKLFKNTIGKKIKDFKIHTAKDIIKASPCFGYVDKDLPKQESYIARLDFEFEDGHDRICFENEYDFTLFHYDWM